MLHKHFLRFSSILLASVLLIMLATPHIVLAKGPPAKVDIREPGLVSTVEITDEQTLAAFSFFIFEQVETNNRRGISPPEVGEGYELTRYIRNQRGNLIAWDIVEYYPNPTGEGGHAFLEGLIGSSYTEFDGKWYPVSPEGDTTIRELLATNGVDLTAPASLPATGIPHTPFVGLSVLAAALVTFGALLRIAVLRRARTMHDMLR